MERHNGCLFPGIGRGRRFATIVAIRIPSITIRHFIQHDGRYRNGGIWQIVVPRSIVGSVVVVVVVVVIDVISSARCSPRHVGNGIRLGRE